MAAIKSIEKQGILTILGCDIKPIASLRRTLSADMSSKKWLSQNGFFSMKKIASSNELVINGADSSSSSSESEGEYEENQPGQDEIWRLIQSQKEKNNNQTDLIPSRLGSWDSILSQKNDQDSSKNSPPPPVYVHPLVKRSASSLSQKSLEICTENLGSETGSDGLILISSDLSLPQTENNSPQKLSKFAGDSNIVKYKTVSPRPLPPPISSIRDEDGNSLRMQSRRENGKLILEAVSVPSRNVFQASRCNGRLILTLINPLDRLPAAMEVEEEVVAKVDVQNSNPTNGDKSGLMVKKFVGVRNKINPTWSNKFNKIVTMEEPPLPPLPPPPLSLQRVARMISTPPSLPPPPPPPSASINAYEYFWRNKTSYITTTQCISHKNNYKIMDSNGEKTYEHQDLVLMLRGCKEQRKSLSIWEPYCIATS